MTHVKISGWNVGLKKVSLTLLLREKAGLTAKDAHYAVQRVLDNEPVVVEFDDQESANAFARKARELGAILEGEPCA